MIFDTGFPADSVEFCPHPNAQNIFACGTYKLGDSADASGTDNVTAPVRRQHRRGQCMWFKVTGKNEFEKVQEISLPAVLDMKWCHRSASATAVLGIADSCGRITLHEWRDNQTRVLESISCASSDVLCLSLDWSNRRSFTTNLGSLVVSLSNGALCLMRPVNTGLSITDSWTAHDYEPWVAAWNYWDTNVIYSGGDDLKMKGWDARQGFSHPIFLNQRFSAGVTAIQSHPHTEHIIAVGSYDSTVGLFDIRMPQTPLIQANAGGGAWRVKWHPLESRKSDLLVACMHDGFKILRFDIGTLTANDYTIPDWQVMKRFDAHQSLAYGADWSFAECGDDQTLIGSCSFYDHALQLWSG